jgi:hypothetical protein
MGVEGTLPAISTCCQRLVKTEAFGDARGSGVVQPKTLTVGPKKEFLQGKVTHSAVSPRNAEHNPNPVHV